MSQTASHSLTSASHWSFVAAATADFLKRWMDSPVGQKPVPPESALRAAKRFLSCAIGGIAVASGSKSDDFPSEPLAAVANFEIAVRASKGTRPSLVPTPAALAKELAAYSHALELLEAGRSPNGSRADLAGMLAFFEALQRDGDRSAYEEHCEYAPWG